MTRVRVTDEDLHRFKEEFETNRPCLEAVLGYEKGEQ